MTGLLSNRTKALFAVLLYVSVAAPAQNVLSRECNLLHSGDCITMERVEYMPAGDEGDGAVWDFSGVEAEGTYRVSYGSIDDSHLAGYDPEKTCKFSLEDGNLQLCGYESRLLGMNYQAPQLVLPLPFQLNQSVTTSYAGEGKYCGHHYERTFGTVSMTADGQGILILSEKDTLRNTLRVYSVTTEAIRLNADSCLNDSDNLKQVITERYQWFARGYRYPVLETVTSSTYDNLDHVATTRHAYRCLPEIQRELTDSVNEQIRLNDQLAAYGQGADTGGGERDAEKRGGGNTNFSYEVQVSNNHVTLTYDVEASAQVRVMVVDVMGTIYRSEQQSSPAGTGYVMNIDCNGLRRGQYVIYINVNGIVYNAKIPVK